MPNIRGVGKFREVKEPAKTDEVIFDWDKDRSGTLYAEGIAFFPDQTVCNVILDSKRGGSALLQMRPKIDPDATPDADGRFGLSEFLQTYFGHTITLEDSEPLALHEGTGDAFAFGYRGEYANANYLQAQMTQGQADSVYLALGGFTWGEVSMLGNLGEDSYDFHQAYVAWVRGGRQGAKPV